MTCQWNTWVRLIREAALAVAVLVLTTSAASAQTMGGSTTGSSTAAGGGGGGGSGSGGTANNLGTSITNLGPTQNAGPTISIPAGGAASRGVGAGNTGTIPTTSNLFAPYYANLYQAGAGNSSAAGTGTSASGAFGQPLFGTANVTSSAAAGGAATTSTTANGFTTWGKRRAPSYYTVLSDDLVVPQHPPAKLQADLQGVLQRSSVLQGRGNIQVVVNGSNVILRGRVNTPREQRLAEGVVRITPGVINVQNDLQVGPPAPSNATSTDPGVRRASN